MDGALLASRNRPATDKSINGTAIGVAGLTTSRGWLV
ncbi:hypothetical protein J2S42_000533 [Catenuloplanes indicus]|uniref:Uncharacterized protein n=1 Tax=Catenuloplanes indicus TaxID=137267 RepID=A0AAE3VUF4_9ACTN|nr:hypothetical protein [Catenuloplanes indicus]